MHTAFKEWGLGILAVSLLLAIVALFGLQPAEKISSPVSEEVIPQQPTGSATLTILPASIDLILGTETTLSVVIEAEEPVTAVELHLSFNPAVVRVEALTPGEFFPEANVLVKELDNKQGIATFIVGGLAGRTGQGQVAHIVLAAVGLGKTEIAFDPSTQAAAIGKTESVLKDARGTVVRVQEK